MIDREELAKRLADVATKLENLETLPKPYNLYYAVKNDGEGTGWRYVVVDIGVTDIRQAAAALTSAGEGAVPVGYMRPEDVGKLSFWVSCQESSYYRKPVYAAAPHPPRQDGAREDIVDLRETLERITRATASSTNCRTAQEAFSWTHAVAASALDRTTPPAPDEAVEAPIAWACQANDSEWEHTNDMRYMERLRSEGWTIYSMYVEDRARSRRDVGGGV